MTGQIVQVIVEGKGGRLVLDMWPCLSGVHVYIYVHCSYILCMSAGTLALEHELLLGCQ